MYQFIRYRLRLSDGEQGLVLAYFGVAFFGAVIAYSWVSQLGGGAPVLRTLSLYETWIVVSGSLGACFGVFVGQEWLGQHGLRGIGSALIGMLMVSFVGAVSAGTMALPLYGTMFGPLMVLMIFIGSPLLAGFWCVVLVAAHLLIRAWRKERDSIFAGTTKDGLPA
jgi:hypothetical protein